MDRNSGTNIPPPYLLTQTQGRIDKRGLTNKPQPIPPKGLLLILPSHPRHRFYQATPPKALRSPFITCPNFGLKDHCHRRLLRVYRALRLCRLLIFPVSESHGQCACQRAVQDARSTPDPHVIRLDSPPANLQHT